MRLPFFVSAPDRAAIGVPGIVRKAELPAIGLRSSFGNSDRGSIGLPGKGAGQDRRSFGLRASGDPRERRSIGVSARLGTPIAARSRSPTPPGAPIEGRSDSGFPRRLQTRVDRTSRSRQVGEAMIVYAHGTWEAMRTSLVLGSGSLSDPDRPSFGLLEPAATPIEGRSAPPAAPPAPRDRHS